MTIFRTSLINISEYSILSRYIYDIGYVDTGLIDLAKRLRLPIITKDRKILANIAENQSIKVIVPSEFLSRK